MRKRTYNISDSYNGRLDAKYKATKHWVDTGNSVMFYTRKKENPKYTSTIDKYKKARRGLGDYEKESI